MESIAEVSLYCVDSAQGDFTATLGVSAPCKNKHGDFETKVIMSELEPDLPPVIGDTSFQSLCLALSLVKVLLESFIERGGKIYFSKEEPVELTFSANSETNFSSLFGNIFDGTQNVEEADDSIPRD